MQKYSKLITAVILSNALLSSVAEQAFAVDIPAITNPNQYKDSVSEPHEFQEPIKLKKDDAEVTPLKSPNGSEKATFTTPHFKLEGNTLFSEEDLSNILAPHTNTPTTVKKLYSLADDITTFYRNKGFILAKTTIPPQDIVDGKPVTIYVNEGALSNIIFKHTGNANKKSYALPERIISSLQNSKKPLNINELEEKLLLANDLAGTTVTSAIVPSETDKDAVDLAITIDIQKNVKHVVTIDNSGSKFVGPFQAGYRATVDNIAPNHQTSVALLSSVPTDELLFGQWNYTMPVNKHGTKVSFEIAHSRSNPGSSLESQDINSRGYFISLSMNHPLIRSREQNLNVGLSLNHDSIFSDIFDNQNLYKDRINSVTTSLTYDNIDSFRGTNLATFGITKGLDIFGHASSDSFPKSRAEGENDFIKYNAYVARLQKISKNNNLYFASSGQYSNDKLLSSEEFSYGGSAFGRGYDPSEITGDKGLASLIELRTDISRFTPEEINLNWFSYYDIAKVWNNDLNILSPIESAASAGTGLRFDYKDLFSGDITLAYPLTKPVENPHFGNGKSPRILFSLYFRK